MRRQRSSWVVVSGVAVAVIATGCGDGANGGALFGDAPDSGVGASATQGDGDGDGDVDGGEPRFDVAAGGSDGADDGSFAETCSKVDVLYVIDNSPSMYEEQQTLIANFDAFVSDMQDALADVDDYHIGVVTTDDFGTSGAFDDGSNTVNQSYPQCQKLGGLVRESKSGDCGPFAQGGNFISSDDDLATKFACIANVGEDGDSDEKVGDAIREAMNPVNQKGGTCNEGFLRDDALLILVILTDENDASDSSTTDWYASVIAEKLEPENVVALALIWDDKFSWGCEQDLSESTGWQIREFVEKFPNHSVGNICESSYAGFFSAAIPTIEKGCSEFVPPG